MGLWVETTPQGEDLSTTIDTLIQGLKVEIRKRSEDLIDNWASDPNSVTMDLLDDVVIAEHISGFTGTGVVSMDNVPNGGSFSRVNLNTLSGSAIEKLAAACAYASGITRYRMFSGAGYGVGAVWPDYVFGFNGKQWAVDDEGVEVVIPICLPHGAVVTEFKVFYKLAGDDTVTVTSKLYRRVFDNGSAADEMADASYSDTPGTPTAFFNVVDSTIANATIANTTHKYWASVTLTTSSATSFHCQFLGCRVKYTQAAPLP